MSIGKSLVAVSFKGLLCYSRESLDSVFIDLFTSLFILGFIFVFISV